MHISGLYFIFVVLMELFSDRSFCLHHIHAEITRSARAESCVTSSVSPTISHILIHECASELVEIMLKIEDSLE